MNPFVDLEEFRKSHPRAGRALTVLAFGIAGATYIFIDVLDYKPPTELLLTLGIFFLITVILASYLLLIDFTNWAVRKYQIPKKAIYPFLVLVLVTIGTATYALYSEVIKKEPVLSIQSKGQKPQFFTSENIIVRQDGTVLNKDDLPPPTTVYEWCKQAFNTTSSEHEWSVNFVYAPNSAGEVCVRKENLVTDETKFLIQEHMDWRQSRSKFMSICIPKVDAKKIYMTLVKFPENVEMFLKDNATGINIHYECSIEAEAIDRKNLKFTGMIYAFHETQLTDRQKADLKDIFQQSGYTLVFKGPKEFALIKRQEK